MSKLKNIANENLSPGAAFTALFGIIIFCFVNFVIGALMIVGALVWWATHRDAGDA